MAPRPQDYPILVVEDNDVDFRQTQKAFRDLHIANPVSRCIDGEDALDFLYRRGKYAEPHAAPRPSMILLDLNLPGTDGRAVLRDIKANADLRQIPVIVFTTSEAPIDVEDCYQAGANTYVKKPVDFPSFIDAMRRLDQYWFQIAVLPKIELTQGS
ncbi:MAG: response regulator [Planctomycetaceae bacterium]|nr:response regulator [Planctomycetaceae bacterium]